MDSGITYDHYNAHGFHTITKHLSASGKELMQQSVDECRKLLIQNLREGITAEKLEQFFNHYLTELIYIPRHCFSGRTQGYAYAVASTASEAQRAMRELNGQTMDDLKVSVGLCHGYDDPPEDPEEVETEEPVAGFTYQGCRECGLVVHRDLAKEARRPRWNANEYCPICSPKNNQPYRTVFEFVTTSKKQFQFQVTDKTQPPPGYTHVPIEMCKVAAYCREKSKKERKVIYIVSSRPSARSLYNIVSQQINRIGYHFESTIVSKALTLFPTSGDGPGVINTSHHESQQRIETIYKLIKVHFANISDKDTWNVIGRAFNESNKRVVGAAEDLPLSDRVQLAVSAYVRHTYTPYDAILRSKNWTWHEAREMVAPRCVNIMKWFRGEYEKPEAEKVQRVEVVVLDSSDEGSNCESSSDIETEYESCDAGHSWCNGDHRPRDDWSDGMGELYGDHETSASDDDDDDVDGDAPADDAPADDAPAGDAPADAASGAGHHGVTREDAIGISSDEIFAADETDHEQGQSRHTDLHNPVTESVEVKIKVEAESYDHGGEQPFWSSSDQIPAPAYSSDNSHYRSYGYGHNQPYGYSQHQSHGYGHHQSNGYGQHQSHGYGHHQSNGYGQHQSHGYGHHQSNGYGQHQSNGYVQHQWQNNGLHGASAAYFHHYGPSSLNDAGSHTNSRADPYYNHRQSYDRGARASSAAVPYYEDRNTYTTSSSVPQQSRKRARSPSPGDVSRAQRRRSNTAWYSHDIPAIRYSQRATDR